MVVMDTGSSDLWVPAANCQSEACKVHETFGSADSSTLQATTTPWQIQYGTGSAAGVLVADTFTIGGLSVQRMPFGVATQLSSNFAQFVQSPTWVALTDRRRTGFWDWRSRKQTHKALLPLWINWYCLILYVSDVRPRTI